MGECDMAFGQSLTQALEIKSAASVDGDLLFDFFLVIKTSGDSIFFHPHAFTRRQASIIVEYSGRDLYYVMVHHGRILGYAMLRGWDEGYQIPSLALIIHPEFRKMGLGRLMMLFLQKTARLQGAEKILLKVYPENSSALKLYQSLGYRFDKKSGAQLVGYLDLSQTE